PRTGGAYDSHRRTAGIAGRTRRRGRVAARGARRAGWKVVTIRLLARGRRRDGAKLTPAICSAWGSSAGPEAGHERRKSDRRERSGEGRTERVAGLEASSHKPAAVDHQN